MLQLYIFGWFILFICLFRQRPYTWKILGHQGIFCRIIKSHHLVGYWAVLATQHSLNILSSNPLSTFPPRYQHLFLQIDSLKPKIVLEISCFLWDWPWPWRICVKITAGRWSNLHIVLPCPFKSGAGWSLPWGSLPSGQSRGASPATLFFVFEP